jgi:hypothetical protein
LRRQGWLFTGSKWSRSTLDKDDRLAFLARQKNRHQHQVTKRAWIMKSLKNKFRATAVAIAALGIILPQTAWAGGHGGGGHSMSHSSGGSGGNSQPRMHHQPPASSVIPAPNGNTGVTGIGLPKPLDASKGHSNGHDSKNLSLGGGVELPKHVKSAPNGNTGITGIGLPNDSSKTPASFAGSDGGRLGILSSMAGGATANQLNSGVVGGAKSDLLKFGQLGGHHNDFPHSPSSSNSVLRTTDPSGLGILGKNSSANGGRSSGDRPKNQHNNGGIYKDSNGTRAEMITKIEANAPYRSNVRVPNYSPAKVTVGPSTSPIKPLVDQEVRIGPKLPGEAGVLGKGVLGTPANSATRVAPMKRTTHTAGFDLGPLDPTGGIINAGLEAGQAWLGGGGGDAASAGGGAAASGGAAAGGVIPAVISDGSGGGSLFGNAFAKASEVAAHAAAAAQSVGGASAAGGFVGGTFFSLAYAVQGKNFWVQLAGERAPGEKSRTTTGPGLKGGAAKKHADSKDGRIGKVKESLSGGAGSSADIQTQIKAGTLASSATNLAQAARKIESVPTQTLPAGPIVDGSKNPTGPATNSARGSRVGSLLQNLSGGMSGSESPGAGGSDGGGAAPATPATTDVVAQPTATDATITPPVVDGADLVLENIELAAPATLVAGPAYRVKFRNQGTAAAGKFEVAVVAGLDGQLTADAPRAVVDVNSLAAGQSGEVTLRLPQSALKMPGAVDGKPAVFTHLFVAVDLMNTVAETDETNNTAVVERAAVDGAAAN